jgi:tetratricopeptide repeat protein 8
MPRPGTSLNRPLTQSATNAALKPVTQSGRPTTGFARPGTSARPLTGASRVGTGQRTSTASQRVATVLRGSKPGTARPTTTSGRFVRLGTASLASQPGGPFINVEHLDMSKYAQRKHLARILCDYIMYNDPNTKCASVLCQAAVVCSMLSSGTAHPAGSPADSRCHGIALLY